MTGSEVRRVVANRMGYMPGNVAFWSELCNRQKADVGRCFLGGETVGDQYAYGVTIQGEILCRHRLTADEIRDWAS